MAAVNRFYQQWVSAPTFIRGACTACGTHVTVESSVNFANSDVYSCSNCGAQAPRQRIIRQSLANLDALTWSLFGSDLYISDQLSLDPSDHAVYNMAALDQVKWHHQEAYPTYDSGSRYVAQTVFLGVLGVVSLQDTARSMEGETETPPAEAQAAPEPVQVFWWRFGLQNREAVPAWRQSLHGAATLVQTNPSAALVLIASGFESFFIETMRIAWLEGQMDASAFQRLNKRNLPISNLIEWLPATVDMPSLPSDNTLYERWKRLVNARRNSVVHRAVVHFTPDEAKESMLAALECIEFIDAAALVRPHAFYNRPDAPPADYTPDE